MTSIDKNKFAALADFNSAPCISIFMPTHRAGMEVNEDQDVINFKNQLQAVGKQLEGLGLKERTIEELLQPAQDLLIKGDFWRQQLDGLAAFIGSDFFEYYTLPVHFDNFYYIANQFYLRPLLSLFNDDGKFFLLQLSQNGTRFFEGTRHSFTEVEISQLVPEELRDVVGYDYEEKSLQWRGGATGMSGGGAMFHGQGRNNSDDKDEIKRYCRAINDGLMEILREASAPMVIACDDYIYAIYQEVNDYKHLFPKNISGNTEHKAANELHDRAWNLVENHFQQGKKDRLDQFGGFLAYEKASNDLETIVAAAVNGRVDTLFLQNGAEAYGIFDPANQTIRLEEAKTPANVSLLNLAAIQTFLQQGTVYLLEPAEMPNEQSTASAIFRY